MKGSDEDKIASVLKGNTLRVYWHVLRSRGEVVGVRDTQRALGFSSPALAIYHFDKLVELGLVERIFLRKVSKSWLYFASNSRAAD